MFKFQNFCYSIFSLMVLGVKADIIKNIGIRKSKGIHRTVKMFSKIEIGQKITVKI